MFFLLFFWGFNLALVGCKDTRRDENNPSGSGRLARVCVLARLYPGSGQWIRFLLFLCALLLVLTLKIHRSLVCLILC